MEVSPVFSSKFLPLTVYKFLSFLIHLHSLYIFLKKKEGSLWSKFW